MYFPPGVTKQLDMLRPFDKAEAESLTRAVLLSDGHFPAAFGFDDDGYWIVTDEPKRAQRISPCDLRMAPELWSDEGAPIYLYEETCHVDQYLRCLRLWGAALDLYYDDLLKAYLHPYGHDAEGVRRDILGSCEMLSALCEPLGLPVALVKEAYLSRIGRHIEEKRKRKCRKAQSQKN